ncbi:MAG: DUF4190 domain-containing protein [Spirochaetia bacterium]|nr:DUF4190 domain-containing protein [Spirochaetia bacterium]
MGNKSKTAIAALVVGIVCFLNLLGTEKAMAAIIIGWMGLQEIKQEEKTGKGLAIAGIILGIVYIITVAVLLIVWGPQFFEHLQKMKG